MRRALAQRPGLRILIVAPSTAAPHTLMATVIGGDCAQLRAGGLPCPPALTPPLLEHLPPSPCCLSHVSSLGGELPKACASFLRRQRRAQQGDAKMQGPPLALGGPHTSPWGHRWLSCTGPRSEGFVRQLLAIPTV